MSKTKAYGALRQYDQVGVHSEVESASPHRLIQMLMEGALAKIATAKGHLQRGQIAKKGENVGWAISIIEGLRASLDAEAGGQIAADLERLYDYMIRRLVQGNADNSVATFDEVHALLREIKAGWDGIADVIPLNAMAGQGAAQLPRDKAG